MLLGEGLLRLVLVYALPVDVMAGISPVMRTGVFAALIGWTVWYSRRGKRRMGSTSDVVAA
ncbi:hypothetical protein GCM10010470_10330 [Saccharopolyspora taberi]|uniref:Uncharacterized protein n=1 Tax=Saccharopolyspora taberi TaxID=60895 RepID=A0ABN3V540_9PSEU